MVKKLFIVAAMLGLIVNFYSDIALFKQNKEAVKTGDWVTESYRTSQLIDATRIALHESYITKEPVDQLLEKIKKLNSVNYDSTAQKILSETLAAYTPEQLLTINYRDALGILTRMEALADAFLTERIKDDEKSNALVMANTMYANIFDIFLIFIFAGFFFYERNRAAKIQKALTKTLVDVDANNQKLQMALAQKKAQLKTTVHDLKNPLGSIRGFAELIYDEAGNKDSILKMADVIQKVSNSSLVLVGALLDENESEGIAKEKINVISCLQEVCSFLEPIASDKKQKIKFDNKASRFEILAHRHQVQDIFFNIVGNALKFSPKGSTILVECSDESGAHEIRVIDSGPGFTKDDFSKLFIQGAKLSAKPTGNEISTGLGLYSVKQTLDSLGGKIQAANAIEGGACMSIRFPLNDLAATLPPRYFN